MPKTRKFDVARFLESDADIALYLSEALETGDAAYLAHAFGAVARARGLIADGRHISRRCGRQ